MPRFLYSSLQILSIVLKCATIATFKIFHVYKTFCNIWKGHDDSSSIVIRNPRSIAYSVSRPSMLSSTASQNSSTLSAGRLWRAPGRAPAPRPARSAPRGTPSACGTRTPASPSGSSWTTPRRGTSAKKKHKEKPPVPRTKHFFQQSSVRTSMVRERRRRVHRA